MRLVAGFVVTVFSIFSLVLGPIFRTTPSRQRPLSASVHQRQADATATAARSLPSDWWSTIQTNLRLEEYAVSWQTMTPLADVPAAFQAPNRAHNLRTYFTPAGPRVIPRDTAAAPAWEWGLELVGYGTAPVPAADLVAEGRRVEYRRGGLTEWYLNDERGLEQGFTLSQPPAPGATRLQLELAVVGTLTGQLTPDRSAIRFTTPAGVSVLEYGQVLAVDARGRALPATLDLTAAARVRLDVDLTGAAFPITIDPLATSTAWTAESDQAGAWYGISTSTAGDVNGDGFSDVIVGAMYYDNGQTDEGRAYVYYGSASGLSTSPDWTTEGNSASARYGYVVSTAGDVNGDGYADVIVGAPTYSNGAQFEGRIYLYFGAASGLSTTAVWSDEGDTADANLGSSVAAAGDINGDGFGDLIVGGWYYYDNHTRNTGKVYVYLGSANGPSPNANWLATSDHLDSQLGHAVSGAGDVNGDGYADIVFGAYGYDVNPGTPSNYPEGQAYVYFGSAAGLGPNGTPANADWVYTGDIDHDAGVGVALGPAGDVNGDGYGDLAIGAPGYNSGLGFGQGRAYVFFGSSQGLASTPNWTSTGIQDFDWYGAPVRTAGDVNGDGYADLVVGAEVLSQDEVKEGAAFVFLGSSVGLSSAPAWSGKGNQANSLFGKGASTAGDVNGDGYSDLILGAPQFDNGHSDEGRAFVYHGSPNGLSTSPDWTGAGDQPGAFFGAYTAKAGDVNGDGLADVLVGAYGYDNGQTDEGRAYLYFGTTAGLSTSPDWMAEGNQAGANFGVLVNAAGDVNDDGYDDFLIAATDYDGGQADEGRVSVYYGSASGPGPAANWSAAGGEAGAYFGSAAGSAGDVNGDGYGDIVVGAWYYWVRGQGRVRVYPGSADGLSSAPVWTYVDAQAGSLLGSAAADAGDVNGDGYSDLIVGAYDHDGDLADEGQALLFLGSATGLSQTPDWSLEGNQAGSRFGVSVGTAGDVNGDGYADVIVGQEFFDNGQSDEGRAVIYYGSAAGLSGAANWAVEGNQAGARLGGSVRGAGDVNGDGYADVVAAAWFYDNGQVDEGQAQVYLGSPAGPSALPDWTAEGDQAGANFGASVGSAGDVNGDGYADVLIGAGGYDAAQTDAGRAYVFQGNGGGLSLRPQQLRADGTTPIARLGTAGDTAVQLALSGRTPYGRGLVKLEWEVKPVGVLLDGSDLHQSSAWTDTGTAGAQLSELVSDLDRDTQYHWRVRVRYHPLATPYQPFSRWLTQPWNGQQEARFRTQTAACTPSSRESDIVLVIDRSGSMGNDNKLADAQAALHTFITAAQAPPDQLALVAFANDAGLAYPLTVNKAAVDAAVQALTVSAISGTRIDLALQQARLELVSARHLPTHFKVIVLLTDGQQTAGDNAAVLSEANGAKAEGATLFTIGLGPDVDTDLLQQVASGTDRYYFAPTSDDLAAIYQQISSALQCGGGDIVFTKPQPAADSSADSNVWIMNADGSAQIQLTPYGGEDRWPSLAPDGSRIAYVSRRNDQWTLWVMNRNGSNPQQLPLAGQFQRPAWSPEGARLAFSRDTESGWEIWTANADGSAARRLTTTPGASSAPAWSPTQDRLAFASSAAAYSSDLYTVNDDGSGQTLLTSASQSGFSHDLPAWSPDGRLLATLRWPAGSSSGPYELWVMTAAGRYPHLVASGLEPPQANHLAWTPDGRWLLFARDGQVWQVRPDGTQAARLTSDGGWQPAPKALAARVLPPARTDAVAFVGPEPGVNSSANVWVMEADGTNRRQVSNRPGDEQNPALTLDGTRLAYQVDGNTAWSVWVAESDGSRAAPVPFNGQAMEPAWTPEGDRLALRGDDGSGWEIWTINPDGSGAQRLTDLPEAAGSPAWSADGTRLAFVGEAAARTHNLYVVNADGSGLQLLASAAQTGYSYHRPAWSPDGSQIAVLRYAAGSDGPYDLWLLNTSGGGGQLLAAGVDRPQLNRLAWSRDGSWLVFSKEGQLWRVRIDGNGLTQLTTGGGWEPSTNVRTFSASPNANRIVYLPAILRSRPFAGLFGFVTDNGQPAPGVGLELVFFNGATWSVRATATTEADGYYSFPSAPSLSAGQAYYVRYDNPGNSARLAIWYTRLLEEYRAGTTMRIGSFDIANITLSAPASGAGVYVPVTFSWVPRPGSPSDSYALDIFELDDGEPEFYTPPLGYVSSYVVQDVPAGFVTGNRCGWFVLVHGSEDGLGISYYYRMVTFLERGQAAVQSWPGETALPDLPLQPPLARRWAGADSGPTTDPEDSQR